MVVALWALTVFGVEMDVRAAAGSPTVFCLALHSCRNVYGVPMHACESGVVVLCEERRSGDPAFLRADVTLIKKVMRFVSKFSITESASSIIY